MIDFKNFPFDTSPYSAHVDSEISPQWSGVYRIEP